METARFEKLAEELAGRDPELRERLVGVEDAARHLQHLAGDALRAFTRRARKLGAEHLTNVLVSPVAPDAKHVDCVSFRVERGRTVLLCVAIAGPEPRVRLVGPFQQGKTEGPCSDQPLRGPEVERALEDALVALIQQASAT